MFGVLPLLDKNQLDDSPTLPQTPVLPFLPLLGFQEGLNLSPTLLTSPARGLSHTLLPEGQEELQSKTLTIHCNVEFSNDDFYCFHHRTYHSTFKQIIMIANTLLTIIIIIMLIINAIKELL